MNKMEKETKIGIVYCLYCLETGKRYFGSTINTLKERLADHVCNPTKSSKQIIHGGNLRIFALEEVKFTERHELRARKAFYIKNYASVNKNVPGRTAKESWRHWAESHRAEEQIRSAVNRLIKKSQITQETQETTGNLKNHTGKITPVH